MSRRRYKTFRGGIHPPYNKELSSGMAIEEAPCPPEVIIPLQQHIGAPNQPVVSPGDRVEPGTLVARTQAYVSAPVHSSVAGTVTEIREIEGPAGATVSAVIIATDPVQPAFSAVQRDVSGLLPGEIREVARDAGLVGMGGAAFPTQVKLSPPEGKQVDLVLINACECEPFLTCDHRLLLEKPGEVVAGLELFMRAAGSTQGVIGIEANKMDALKGLEEEASSREGISVEVLEVKYPQGAEKQLICAATGRKVPPGKLPVETGCLVQNVGTAVAMYQAAATGMPLYQRVVTVTGQGVVRPCNLLVRIGTPISVLVEAAGGFSEEPGKVIMGGPMTGWAQKDLGCPVVKGTSGVLVFPRRMVDTLEERTCVRCSHCIDACPMHLMPSFIVDAVQQEDWERAELWGASDCFECGTCSYTCPSGIPHVSYVREAKARIAAIKRG